IAAEQSVILAGRVGRSTGADRHALRNTSEFGSLNLVAGAGIRGSVEAHKRRGEQLLNVGRTGRPIVRSTEADVGNRREFRGQLVRIRVIGAAVAELVPRLTVTGAECEI